MANDTATTRLLYAILSQKCLKDIDWNKVAHDPVLSQEITNGHAARMRYSRFKKQMEGTAPVRRPRLNNSGSPSSSPKKAKVEKSATKSPRKIKERAQSEAPGERVKPEASESGYGTGEGTPEAAGHETHTPSAGVVKREHISSGEENLNLYTPVTPSSSSPTPSPGFGAASSQDMDEMLHSFSLPGHDHMSHDHMSHEHMSHEHMSHEHMSHAQMFPGVMEDPNQAYGLGMQIPLGMGIMVDPFSDGLWGGDHEHGQGSRREGEIHGAGEGSGILVKTEERWEEGYHHA